MSKYHFIARSIVATSIVLLSDPITLFMYVHDMIYMLCIINSRHYCWFNY